MLSRRKCPWCHQELSHSAYYRHTKDSQGLVCPARKESQKLSCYDDSTSVCSEEGESMSASLDSDISDNSKSSFSFQDSRSSDSSSGHCCGSTEAQTEYDSDIADVDSMLEESQRQWSDCSLNDEEEIWDTSSDEDSDVQTSNQASNQVILGICSFINFFQLFYSVSERAILALLAFLRVLFSFLGNFGPSCTHLQHVGSLLPRSLQKIRKMVGRTNEGLIEYAVCPTCSSLYLLNDCIVRENGRNKSKHCEFVRFPNHPHISRRSQCNTPLLKSVKLGKNTKLVPRKLFVYHSIINGIKQLVSRPGFLEMCEQWRNRNDIPPDMYTDIYEGQVWKDFDTVNGEPFLSLPHNLCLMLNIDWFNPYDQTPYSAGVIYFVVQNLPRRQRFKIENIILVGLIPGPSEPKKDVNSFLAPVVTGLNQLLEGISFHGKLVRAVLSCVSCDLPATRKVCGFYNFNALKGCSKCLKEFPTNTFGSKPDYSGFQCETWEKRDYSTQKRITNSAKSASTACAQVRLEQSYGARHTELSRLSYFDVVRLHVIDPMHNLFLGIAKHTVGVWKENNILTSNDLETIQQRVDSMIPPPKVGRIPRKIQSNFFSVTADEWKNWIILYSPYALVGILENSHYACWCTFVEACQLICHPIVTKDDIEMAHMLLVRFCKGFEELYGKENCTPNMHMACHIRDIIFDFGSVYGFWCFSFERYNGILEGMKKSWVSPEKQLLLKFLDLQLSFSADCSSLNTDFNSLVYSEITHLRRSDLSGSLQQMSIEGTMAIAQAKALTGNVSSIDPQEKSLHQAIRPLYEKCFSDAEVHLLSLAYNALFPNSIISHVSRIYQHFKILIMNGEEYTSVSSRSQRSSSIIAHWPSVLGRIDTTGEGEPRIGEVQYFFRHRVSINTLEHINCLFARVLWYEEHPRRNQFHKSIVVCGRLFSSESSSSFIPVSRIMGRCTITQTSYQFDYGVDNITVAVPLKLSV